MRTRGTESTRTGKDHERISEETEEDEQYTAPLKEGKWVILHIPANHLSAYTPKSIKRNETVLTKEPLSSVSGVES